MRGGGHTLGIVGSFVRVSQLVKTVIFVP